MIYTITVHCISFLKLKKTHIILSFLMFTFTYNNTLWVMSSFSLFLNNFNVTLYYLNSYNRIDTVLSFFLVFTFMHNCTRCRCRIVSVSFSVISVNVRRIRYIPLGLKLQLTIHSIGIFNLEMDRSCQMIDRNLKWTHIYDKSACVMCYIVRYLFTSK